MAVNKGLLGNEYTVEDKAIAILIERYNELIQKEMLYDEILKCHDVILTLRERLAVKEESE